VDKASIGDDRPAILIVDDKEDNLAAFKSVLKELNADLVTASSGQEALSRLLEREFAFVLLDVRMPDMDGYEVARILKQDREIGKVPIVFVTAEANMDASVMKGYEAGGFDYLVKPVDPRILLGKARNFLNLHRYQKEAVGKTKLRYNALFNGMSELVAVCEESPAGGADSRLRIAEANPAFERAAGLAPGSARGRLLASVVPDLDPSFEGLCVAVARGSPSAEAERLRLFGKSYFHASVHAPGAGYAAIILTDITGTVEAELRVERLLDDKLLLMQEVHHRVKNNLQIIVSLLELQAGKDDDPRVRDQIKSIQNRVYAIASVHDQLSLSRSAQTVNLAAHIDALAGFMGINEDSSAFRVAFDLAVDPSIELVLDVAVPVTLILQELISNSIRHCGKRNGVLRIGISASLNSERRCVLVVRDDGLGLRSDGAAEEKGGIGSVLIEGLTDQVRGSFSVESRNGYAVTLVFPLLGAGPPLGPTGKRMSV